MGVQVLHCVLYPRLEYDLPILSVDMVGSAATGRISLAIADPCPAAMDRSLPPAYAETVRRVNHPKSPAQNPCSIQGNTLYNCLRGKGNQSDSSLPK